MSRIGKVALWLLCGLLISCSSSQDGSQWYSVKSQHNVGHIEYRGAAAAPRQNGLGGTGKSLFNQPENGLGGTGQQARNGLGGTGSPSEQQNDTPQNGLGGTGQKPGRATIIGSVTAFGSIWVNDRHILLPDETRYFRDGDQSRRNDIRLGQVVAVLADEYGNDYQAVEVHSVNNVIGPLKSIQALTNGKTELQILGQRVIVDNHTRLLNQDQYAIQLHQLVVGQWLAVSGLRAPDQTIRASLIRDWPQQIALLAGPVSALAGGFMLGEQSIQFSSDQPSLDQPLTLTGELINDEFIVDDWQPMPLSRLLELADEFWLEGFPMEDAELYFEGFEIQLPEAFEDLEFDDSISIGFDEDEDEFWFDDAEHDFNEEAFDEDEFEPEYEDEFDDHEEEFEHEEDFEHELDDDYLPDDIYPEDN